MSDSETRTGSARAVDLEAIEGAMRADQDGDLTEAKEGLVDALLGLTARRCTGEGPGGDIIYGGRPSSKLVSGFLLPRFDQTGLEDETSDIRIATMGLDLQLAADGSGEVVIRPEVSVYIRLLPSWDEIIDPRHEMAPQVQLSREARHMVEDRARAYINERIAALPAVDDDQEPEQSGDAVAVAEQAREVADAAAELEAEGGGGDAEARGAARASVAVAERAERVARARQGESARRTAARRDRIGTIAAIRREAFDRAFAELGIHLVTTGPEGVVERLITAADLAEPERSNVSEAASETVPPETDGTIEAEGPPPAAGAVGQVRPGVGRVDDHHAAPQPIPQKWRRLSLELGEFRFDYGDAASRDAAVAAFPVQLLSQLDAGLTAWVGSEEGQRDAYRPGERVMPSQFADRDSWEGYLAQLRVRRPATIPDVRPDLNGVALVAEVDPDFVDPSRINLRVAIENGAAQPGGRDVTAFEHALFQVRLQVSVPAELHRPLRLDRVEPSYRFRDWLEYPAMGLNCGVHQVEAPLGLVSVQTTWAPRYIQPRIDPRTVAGVPTAYEELARAGTDVARLFALPDAYDNWIANQAAIDVGRELPPELADEERRSHARDLNAYRRESGYIRRGIELLRASCEAARELATVRTSSAEVRAGLARRAAPWEAWLRTNETFALYGGTRFTDWRLFQLAFIIAHLPTFASRMPEFEDQFDAFRDELSASLLYFPTGGGKSEAFFGLLVFNLFLDRLRGKLRGVTGLVRYPLRLLTLQQARRLMRILVHAELVRLRRQIPGWPFEIGFWVGSGNTPNRVAQGFGGVPAVTVAAHRNDDALLNPPSGSNETEAAARRRSARYKEALETYDKLRSCPCCGAATGMRKYPNQFGRIGIVCFNDGCDWNQANPPAPHRLPLPFLLTDDTIYQRAPSVVLGTVDKLALIGQHDRTINAVVGMFGCARYMDPDSRHLFVPRGERALARAVDDGWTRVRPAFGNGASVFHDPFPSLVVQDEGHLLDESLGTFSGLFETTLEQILTRLGEGVLRDHVATWLPIPGGIERRPRLPKVIAATATISDPDRQLRVLYQREPLRFPCQGPNLYESFYASPREPLPGYRRAFASSLTPHLRPELSAPRMRVYVSIMTNGRSHTMTTSAVISAYHLVFTRLWRMIVEEGRAGDAVEEMIRALQSDDHLTPLRADALRALVPLTGSADNLATLLDLLRISLTYVTNKKGGDQIIETLQHQVERDQRGEGIGEL